MFIGLSAYLYSVSVCLSVYMQYLVILIFFTEQDERTQESTEQWREFHHDGLDPSYEYNRHTV